MPRAPIAETPEQRESRLKRQRDYEARRKAADPEGWAKAQREAAKRYRERNPEKAREATRKWGAENRDRIYAARKSNRQENHLLWLYREAKARAAKRGLEFSIQFSDIPQISDTCPLLGVPFDKPEGAATAYRASLDRINPALGYVKGNVWWVTYRANLIKNDGTADEHQKIADAMRNALNSITYVVRD